MKSIFLSVFLCFVVAGANAQQGNGDAQLDNPGASAPAGFTWGETKQQIESKGVKVKNCLEHDLGLGCIVDSAPKEISFIHKYILVFIEGHGLQGVAMRTDNFTDDPHGHEGKQLYDKVKQNLISKYGQPGTSNEFIGKDLYLNEFYQCLAYAGCGTWDSTWIGEGGIILDINGLERGVGYINLHYQSKKFGDFLIKKEEAESTKDIDAL